MSRRAQRAQAGGPGGGAAAPPRSKAEMVRRAAPAGLLLAVTLLLYLPALRAGFIWDDDTHLTANIVTQPGGLARSWFSKEQPNYWPVTWTAFWAQWQLFGPNPFGYHLVNVLLHAANAILLWRILAVLAVPGAWFAALLFAIHPVNAECAAWITQLKTLLSMFFYLASLLLYLQHDGGGRRALYWASAALFLVAMLAKPAVVMMPVVLLLLAWWRRGSLAWGDVRRTAPFFAISAVLSLTEIWFQYNVSIMGEVVRDDSFPARLAGSGWVVAFYLGKLLLPVNLMFVYPRWTIEPSAPLSWLPLAAVVAVFAVAAYRRASAWARHLLMGFGYFVASLAPVMGFLNIYFMRYSFVEDHWQYVAMAGPVALVAGGMAWWQSRSGPALRGVLRGVSGCVLLLLAVLCWRHQALYHDEQGLWEETLRRNGKAWIAHEKLGAYLAGHGQYDEAISHFRQSLELKPDLAEAHFNWGLALDSQGRAEESIAQYRKAIGVNPRYALAHVNLGDALVRKGLYGEAEACFRRALDIAPGFAQAHAGLGQMFMRQGKRDEALACYEAALRANPGSADARFNLAAALGPQADQQRVIGLLQEAVGIAPMHGRAHLNLANALARTGQPARALPHFELAARLGPDHAFAHNNWGHALMSLGRHGEAVGHFREALRIDPNYDNAKRGLAEATAKSGSR